MNILECVYVFQQLNYPSNGSCVS